LSDLKRKTIKGIKWSVIDQITRFISTLIISIFLARLILPSEFGKLAMVLVFIGFLEIFKDFGLGSALIHKTKLIKEEIDSVFWLNTLIGLIIAILIFILAPAIANFYKKPDLIPITQVLAVIFFIGSIGIVPDALIRKEIDFKNLFIRNISNILLSGTLAIIMGFLGYGVWALIGQRFVTTFYGVIISFKMIKWRPSLVFNSQKIKSFIHFSLPLFGEKMINYWVRNIDNLSIGKLFGDQSLGYYNKAYNLMLLPVRQISGAISRVLFPTFSIIKDNKLKVWENYLKIINLTAFITFPLMGGLFLWAKDIILLLYGPNWLPAAQMFKGLAFLGAVQSIGVYVGSIFNSQGKTKLQFKIGLFLKPLMIAGILIGLYVNGIMGLIYGYTISSTIAYFVESHYLAKILEQNFIDIIKYFYKESLATIISLGTIFTLNNTLSLNADIRLKILLILIYVLIYLILSYLFNSLAFNLIKSKIYASKKNR